MKIAVLGAGQVGYTVVKSFVEAYPAEPTDITVVDNNKDALRRVVESFSCDSKVGDAALPDVLYDAGVDECDVLIAVTGSDEANLVACQTAYTLFDTPVRIARIRQPSYVASGIASDLPGEGFHISHAVTPELTVVDRIMQLIRFRGMIDVAHLGNSQLVATLYEVTRDGEQLPDASGSLLDVVEPSFQPLVVLHDGQLQVVKDVADTDLSAGDLILFLGDESSAVEFCRRMQGSPRDKLRRIVIAGGGNIGKSLAKKILDQDSKVTIDLIDNDEELTEKIQESLNADSRLTILHGDVTNLKFLNENRVNEADLFVAATNNDLVNLVASLQCKQLHIDTSYTLLTNSDYVAPLRQAGVRIPISPQQTTKNIILSAVRERRLTSFYHMDLLDADLVEFTLAHDSTGSSVATGKKVSQLKVPSGAQVLAIIRENESGNQELLTQVTEEALQKNDHVLCLLQDHTALHKLELLFRLQPQS